MTTMTNIVLLIAVAIGAGLTVLWIMRTPRDSIAKLDRWDTSIKYITAGACFAFAGYQAYNFPSADDPAYKNDVIAAYEASMIYPEMAYAYDAINEDGVITVGEYDRYAGELTRVKGNKTSGYNRF